MRKLIIEIDTVEEEEALTQIFDAALKGAGYSLFASMQLISSKIKMVEDGSGQNNDTDNANY